MMHRPGVSVKPGRPARFRQRLSALALVCALPLAGCFYGLHGGGLPSHIKTIAVVPFDNQTPVADLQREVSDSLRARLTNRLGLRDASVTKADAIVRGTIHRYDADVPVGYTANTRAPTSARRSVTMVLDIEVVDQVTSKTLWSRTSYSVDGQYDERDEATGRSRAIDNLVQAIVEGAQSQW